jgi:hypothetical protein
VVLHQNTLGPLGVNKWTSGENIDIETSTTFWNNFLITNAQKTCILKFWYNQYVENAWKQLFFGSNLYPIISCFICNSLEPNAWKHALLSCTQQYIHALHIKRYNKVVLKLYKLLIQSYKFRCFILMNVDTFNNCFPKNTVSPWLLPCTWLIPTVHG